jgi:hypothetical protein
MSRMSKGISFLMKLKIQTESEKEERSHFVLSFSKVKGR